jgi:hypothetical protein
VTVVLKNIVRQEIGAHALKCKRAVIYPTVHQKLRCDNSHTLELLEKERECTRKRRKKEKEDKKKMEDKKNIIKK